MYSLIAWNILEYLALFVIVMLHEFGHVLACRQVGGRANRIVLRPLGGDYLCATSTTARGNSLEHHRSPLDERGLKCRF